MAPDQVEAIERRDGPARRPAGRDAARPRLPGDRAPDLRGPARRRAAPGPPRDEGLKRGRPAGHRSSTSTSTTRSRSAAARIRAAADPRVGLVLPFGSRVATSRINFRLLAREAMSHGRRLDIVAPDASARALAASAGLPVFASVGEYEAALDAEDDDRRPRRRGGAGGRRDRGGRSGGRRWRRRGRRTAAEAAAGRRQRPPRPARRRGGSTPVGAVDTTPSRSRARSRRRPRDPSLAEGSPIAADTAASVPVARPRRRRRRLTSPGRRAAGRARARRCGGRRRGTCCCPRRRSRSPRTSRPSGRSTFTVTADPSATAVDEAAGVVPAARLTIPVAAPAGRSRRPASASRRRRRGRGPVDELRPDVARTRIPSGTVVRTEGGQGFAIDEARVPARRHPLGRRRHAQARAARPSEVGVTAVDAGPGRQRRRRHDHASSRRATTGTSSA